MFTVAALAALAGSLVTAAPVNVARESQPSTYYTPYLEPYDGYHLRYLALDCQDKHDTTFFDQCCHPLVTSEGETLAGRPSYCTPNATEIASASSYIASTSEYGAPTPTANGDGSAPTTTSTDEGGASEYSSAEASVTSTLTTQAALAPATTTHTKAAAPTTTSQSSSGNSGSNSGTPSGSETGGYATYFYQNGQAGACGNYNPDSKPLVAIDQSWWPGWQSGSVSDLCGKYVTIVNNNNGNRVNAVIADVCPTCANGNSLDLSVGAFTQIASESDGMVPITWWFD